MMPDLDDNWSLTGHEWAVAMLRQHIVNGTARHAYLLTGPPGVGRRTLGLRFAQALNCSNPPAPGIPCGTCDNCQRIAAGTHPDLSVIEAEKEGGTLKVDQVRELRRMIVLRPFQAKYRVVMLLRFQEAKDAAANALLKTLEEAPSYAVLILTAESSDGLLPTVVSRCEVLRLHPVPLERIESLLQANGAPPEKARLLAHISEGRPGAALGTLGDPDLLAYRDAKLNDLAALIQASRAQRFAYAEKLSHEKPSMREVLMIWLSFWRDVLWRAGGAPAEIANIDREREINSLAGQLDLARARQLVAEHDRALRRLDATVNARLVAEVLLLDWPH